MSELKDLDRSRVGPMQRRKARSLVLQALYQWRIAGTEQAKIQADMLAGVSLKKVDTEYFKAVFSGVINNVDEVDQLFETFLDRDLEGLDPVELSVLRIGCYELKYRIDVPYRVVLNEAIELAKRFGGTDGHKFVNSILDRVAPTLRQAELSATKAQS